ncbi:MAG: hypothetical protein GXO19_06630 [Epsilonproteobacteria bacterium]|nr:hypothetical protein [Campylobacterota bacterium]NPA57392.1 hypothetical protein [Campylobacterota bacterium]
MERLIILLLPLILMGGTLQRECDSCHKLQIPYQMIYRRALLLYSSKNRIERALIDFLTDPKKRNSSLLPPGLRMRFNPKEHPLFEREVAREAVRELIEREDILKKFR